MHGCSVYQLPGLWHGVAEFGGFGEGAALLDGDGMEAVLDGIRLLAEGCDSLQVGLWDGPPLLAGLQHCLYAGSQMRLTPFLGAGTSLP